jgi:membrane protease YdiL (CAAX protease family)
MAQRRRETPKKRRGRTAREEEESDEGGAGRQALLQRSRESAVREPRGRRRAARPLPFPDDYLARTRGLTVNVLFLSPLFLAYLACRGWAGDVIETQAASSLRTLINLLGKRGLFILTLCTCLALLAALLSRMRSAKASAPVLPWMAVEGITYGLVLQLAASALSAVLPVGRWIGLFRFPGGNDVRGLGIALGAGIFEELLFRGVLCFGIYRALRAVFGADRWSAGTVAVVLSALTFSAYHHWGVGGEPWDAVRFTFRFHAGALLGVIFLTRGLGVAALAHGFYDALVLLG